MTLTFPRDLVFEAYLGRWVNVTALAEGRSLRQADPVTLNWGMAAEQGAPLAPPSTLEAVLNNTGGHWTPGNAMSDYYAYLQGRNAPVRLALRASRDTFSRTIGAGVDLGFTDTGDGWQTADNGFASFSVGAGVGVISINGTVAYGLAFLTDSYPDCQVALSMPTSSVAFVSVTGGPIEPLNLVQRYQPSGAFAGEHYLLRAEIRTDNAVYVAIYHSSLGALTSFVGPISDALGALSQNVALRAKFQAEGQTLRGKIYRAGPTADPDQYEPLGWQVGAHHDRLSGGFPGFRSGVAGGNTNVKPVTFSHDDWELRLLRHSGEIQKLGPQWDKGHRIKKAAVKCADVTMRLNRPQTPVMRSAVERFVRSSATQPVAYWPMDDGELATEGRVAVGSGAPAFLDDPNQSGILHLPLGSGDVGTWLNPVANIRGNPVARFEPTVPIVGGYTVHCALSHVGGRYSSSSNLDAFTFVGNFILQLFSDSYTLQIFGSFGTSSVVVPQLFDQKVHLLTLWAVQIGADWSWLVYVDGVVVLSGLVVGSTVPTLTRLLYQQNGHAEGNLSRSLGHVAMYAGSTDTTTWSRALFGYPGERSLDRAIRLCLEEGVPLDYWGSPADTAPMGPQGTKKLMDQLKECAEADGAIVYAPRYTPGVAFRSRRSMCARPADATLSYSVGQVAAPLAPSADDRPTANRITASRVDGGTQVVEQASGPMNTKDPGTDPDAVGVSPADAKVNVAWDTQLGDVGGWARALGTVPDIRFPRVTVNLRAQELTSGPDPTLPARQVLGLRPGDRLLVQNLQAADVYRDLDQIVRGGSETYRSVRQHEVTFNTAPYEKFRTAVFGDAEARFDGAVTTFDSALTTTTTGARNVTNSAFDYWTGAAGAFPMDVDCEGERITLSGITGTGAAQVMTISARSVNGVVKAHAAGARVRLWQPSYYC